MSFWVDFPYTVMVTMALSLHLLREMHSCPQRLSCWSVVIALLLSLCSPAAELNSPAMEGGSDDRRSKQSSSSAAAMAGAAMLKVMCLKQMADAQRENDSEKMNMAMMMCAQADALAQNGKENEEGAKKAGSGAPLSVSSPSFEKPEFNAKSAVTNDDPDLGKLPPTSIPNGVGKTQTDSISMDLDFKPETNPEPELGQVFSEDKEFTWGKPIEAKQQSQDTKETSLNLQENSLAPMPLGTASTGSMQRALASIAPFKKTSVPSDSNASEKSKESKENPIETSNKGFDDMLAKYVGSGVAANPFGGGMDSAVASGEMVDIAYGLKVPGQKTKNIFEFASEQYLRAQVTKKPSRRTH